jgi:peptide deformylase
MVHIVQGAKNVVLRKKSEPVGSITPAIRKIVARMEATLAKTENGIGLAAPQIGENVRIFIILPERIRQEEDLWQVEDMPRAFINPELKGFSRDTLKDTEGCLSLPEQWFGFERPKKVTVTATDLARNKIKIHAKGLLARVFQHEVDHLNGVLIVDHAPGHSERM